MPTKHHTSRPAHVIDSAVKRYFDGESVSVLSKFYGVSRACIYLWIGKAKKDALAKSLRAGMTPAAIDNADLRDFRLQLDAERAENRKLKRLCCEWMIRTGDFSMLSEQYAPPTMPLTV